MKDYPAHHRELKRSMKKLARDIPATLQGFSALHREGLAAGTLCAKTKELIALAIAISVRCDGCIAFHVHDALRAGATGQEVTEAIGVAVVMGGGPALMYGCEALEAMEQFRTSSEVKDLG